MTEKNLSISPLALALAGALLALSSDASHLKAPMLMKRNYAASQEAVRRLGYEYAERA